MKTDLQAASFSFSKLDQRICHPLQPEIREKQSTINFIPSFFKWRSALATLATICGLILTNVQGATPYVMSTGDYSESFADIANWTANFASGIGAAPWSSYPITTGGAANDGIRTTKSSATFVSGTSGGLQKGTLNMVFLSTGSATPSEAVAVDLLLDFTGRNAGTLSFDWAAVDNSSGTRPTSLRVFWSVDNTTFAEITAAQVLDVQSPSSGSISAVSLPAAFNGSATAKLRFYNHAGTVTGAGNRDKISIDNIAVTSTASCASPTAAIPTASPTLPVCSGTSVALTETASGGSTPYTYQWKSNGVAISGATSSTLVIPSPINNDQYVCSVTSSCGGIAANSPALTLAVNALVTPSVSVSANPGTTTCAGNQVIFTATPVNGGGSPTYIWKTNSVQDISVPASSATYTNNSLANGETIDCQLATSLTCVTSSTADATQLTMTITASVTPSVSVSASPGTTICAGKMVIFTAMPVNGGSSPAYIWKTNGVQDTSVLNNSATYTNSSLANGDTIDCQLISNDPCASPINADANQIVMTVNATVTPSVTIAAAPGSTICSNSSVTFTATPVNGGALPTFQWKTNGANVTGQTATTFTTSLLKNGDVVTVVMTPSVDICVSPATATSSGITMTVNPNVVPAVSLSASPSGAICVGSSVMFTATPVNGGATPAYQWRTNGVAVTGETASTFTTATLVNGDVVTVIMTPSPDICVSLATATSANLSMTVNSFRLVLATALSENIGTPSGTTTLAANVWQNSAPITFTSTSTFLPDVRNTNPSDNSTGAGTYSGASGGGNVFFTTTSGPRNLVISGINTLGLSSLQLQFGLRRDNAGSGGDAFAVEVSSDGTTYSPLTITQPTVATWTLKTANGTIPATSDLRIRFSKSADASYRLDDVKVQSVATAAAITASGPTAFCAGGSVTLTASAAGSSYVWSTSETTPSITVNSSGTYTVTIFDANGCSSSASQTVTVNPLPTVTIVPAATNVECAGVVTLTADPAGDGPLTYQWYDNLTNTIPNETNVTLTLSDVHSAVAGNYTVVVRGPFCSASAIASLTVTDTLAPAITVLGANPATNECHVAYVDAGATANDACAGAVGVSTNNLVDANLPGIYTVTYTADDGNSNTNTATRTVYVVDTTAPLITYYFTNLTLSADSSCQVLMPDVTGTNYIQAEDVCGAITITQTPTNDALLNLGTNEVVLTVADSVGNTTYSTNSIIVVDTTAPVITLIGANPLTVECHGSFADPGASASDNCSGIVAVSTNGIVNADVPGSYTIEYSADDAAGNSVTNARIVNVLDTIAPVITLNGANPLMVQCHSGFSDPGATAADACAGAVDVVLSGSVDANIPGSYLLTYTAGDGNGNTNSVTRTVNVVDTIGPVIVILGANPATNECHIPYADSGATANDACAGNVVLSTNNNVDANVPGVYVVTYTSDDGNGNTNVATRTVYVVDTLPPMIVCIPDKTVECGSLWSFDEPITLDGCSGTNVTLVVLETMTNGLTFTRTWLASDEAGNTNTCSQSLTVTDTLAPAITVLGANPATNECHAVYTDAGASASDACAGEVNVSTNSTVDANLPGVYTVTYTADDGNGNTNTATRTVYVVDTTAPLITYYFTNLTLSADSGCLALMPDVTGTNYILAEDVCGAITITQTPTNDALLNLGTNEVVLTVADSVGNTTYSTNSIIVVDTTAPVITLNGANPMTVECHDSFADPGASASDNCSGIVAVATNGFVDPNVPGSYTIEYSAADAAGNSVTNARIVNVLDTTPPVVMCGTNKVVTCGSVWAFDEPVAEDSCSGTNVLVTVLGTETNVNMFTRTWAASDPAGNTNTCSQSVLVVDTTPPVISLCPTNRSLTSGENCFALVPDFTGELVASDLCSGVYVSQNPTAGTQVGVGEYVVTLTASDVTSNTSVCTLLLTVTSPPGANTNISISEFMAKNTVGITDDYGLHSDWIEIHNAGSCPVNLDGWALTDDVTQLTKWRFPATNIAAGQYLVVWASDKDQRIPGAPLHTNFKLADEGEYLALVQPDGVTIAMQFNPTFPPQLPDVSYGLPAGSLTNNYLAWPTPGLANSPATNINGDIIITEFLAKNIIGIVDDFGVHSDWIEVYNAGCCPTDLNGWSLTDDPTLLTKWRFPSTNIGPGQFLVVWASDKNRRIPGAPLHTNFKMGDEGEYLALVRPNGTIATQFSPTFPPQLPDVSYGLPADSLTNNYLAWSTPGSANSPGTNFLVANLEVSPERGWFTNSVSVTLGSPTPGVTIYFTTNGTVPGPANGLVYSGPLIFTNTTVLRVAAYRAAYVPNLTTHTYVFPKEVAYQTGAGFPTNWGIANLPEFGFTNQPVPAYYTCNSNLVNDLRWGNQMPAALLSLPTLSVVMNPDDMFGTNGIYSNTFGDGDEWERPCSVEYFRPDGQPGFEINCGIRIHGQGSRNPAYTPKHNLRFLFKQMYGSGKLVYDLFPGSPVQDFDVLVLHASLTDHWYVTGAAAQEQRNQWCADTQREMGGSGTHGTYVNLYINGLYWGMYNLGERPDASYAAHYLGGRRSDYDAFNGNELMDGTTNAWNELMTLAEAGITNDVAWSNACYYLNVPQFIDYLLINFYALNTEEFDHNWWIAGDVSHGVPFQFFSWDAEDGLGAYGPETPPITYNIVNLAGSCPTWLCVLHSSLLQHPEYRRLFGDHVQRLLFNHGALTPERCQARWMNRAREIDTAIIAESTRWGITNWWGIMPYAEWILYTRDHWLAQQNFLATNWFPRRTDILIGHLRDAGLYPATVAPVFSPHGGIIVESLSVAITTPTETTLYYTTNGVDPRLPDGNLSPEALVSDQLQTTLIFTNNSQLRARAFGTNGWSALTEADYLRSEEAELRISAIKAQSDGAVKLDFQTWPGVAYTLRASTNLYSSDVEFTHWEPIATVVPFPDGTFTFVDTAATNYPVRFYRLTWP